MPIVYMHGVNTRDRNHFAPVKEYLERIVAPAISSDPKNVSIRPADWFKYCDPPKYGGISRPATLLGHGAELERNELLDAIIRKAPPVVARPSLLTSGQEQSSAKRSRLDGLSDDELADLIAITAASGAVDPIDRARIGIAADRIAHDVAVKAKLKAATNIDEQLGILAEALRDELKKQSELEAHGVSDFFQGMHDRVNESFSRVFDAPLTALSVAGGELRPNLNAFATRFLGDLLFYVTRRGKAESPGPIPRVLIEEPRLAQKSKDARGGEPVVLLTHSMGGQIAYDVVSSFLPLIDNNVKVDFWCATASQVGFFEERNMFVASSDEFSTAKGKRTPSRRTLATGGTFGIEMIF